MKQYNMDEFIPFVPTPENKLFINFHRERAFNLNAALCAELGPWIEIAIHPKDPVLRLGKSKEGTGMKVPASGSIKLKELNDKLIEAHIRPPVRLVVTKQGNYWIAEPETPRIPEIIDMEKPEKSPRRVSPERIIAGTGPK